MWFSKRKGLKIFILPKIVWKRQILLSFSVHKKLEILICRSRKDGLANHYLTPICPFKHPIILERMHICMIPPPSYCDLILIPCLRSNGRKMDFQFGEES